VITKIIIDAAAARGLVLYASGSGLGAKVPINADRSNPLYERAGTGTGTGVVEGAAISSMKRAVTVRRSTRRQQGAARGC